MKITPRDKEGALLINGYGGMGFRINGERYEGSVIITLSEVIIWPARAPEDITVAALDAIFGGEAEKPDILLVGCGPRFLMLPQTLRDWAKERGIMLDSMDTGAAARTYNILRQEDRAIAAALLAVE
jgi:uncharacterized protein